LQHDALTLKSLHMSRCLSLLSVSFTCLFAACSFIAKTVNHVKKPKVETAQSIKAWLQKEKISSDKILTVDPSNFYHVFLLYGERPMLFNERGVFVSVGYNSDPKFCPKGVKEFLSTLTPGFEKNDEHLFNYIAYRINNRPDTLYPTLNKVYSFARDLYGNEVFAPITFGSRNYILVVPFTIFSGNTIQTSKMRAFINACRQNASAKIDIILVNFDKQEWWGKEWNEKIHIEV
jgi:hypothetical protein